MYRATRLVLSLAFVTPSVLCAQGFGPSGGRNTQGTPSPPLLIIARVVDANGKPIEGAGLAVCRGATDAFDTGVTRTKPFAQSDAAGRLSARVERVEGKSTSFFLSAKGKVCVQLLPRTTNAKVGGKEVAKADLGVVILRDGVDISGLVRSQDGKPIAGAHVVATGVLARMMNDAARRSANFVRESTLAVADSKGIVRLRGVSAYGASVRVTAAGFYPTSIAYLNRHTPLVATLERGGEIIGRVLDAAGKPVKDARVVTRSEYATSAPTKITGADGAFRLDVPGPGRYRIYYYARPEGATRYTYLWSEVLRGPQPGLDLSLGAAVQAKQAKQKAAASGLIVKVTEKKTGVAIREARAVAMWYPPNMWQSNPGYLEGRLHSSAKVKTDEQGKITLRGPAQGQPSTGRLMVVADGYAPVTVKDLVWDDDAKKNEVALQLVVESVLGGAVKDAQGKPIPGAKVFVTTNPAVVRNYVPQPMRRKLDGQHGMVTTNDKGEFKIGSLGEGKHYVYFSHAKYAETDPVEIDLGAQKSKTDLNLTLQKGATIFGKLVGVTPKLGWRVRIQRLAGPRQNNRSYYGLNVNDASEFVPVTDEGTFEIEGLTRANYNLALVMPGGEARIEVPIEPLRVRSKDLHREFDIGEEMPGRMEGEVVIRGATLLPGRLMLLAVPCGGAVTNYYSNRPNLMGYPTLVGAGGTFSLRAPEGKYFLQLVDLATAVTLYQGRQVIKVSPRQTATVALAADLASVTVKLVPEKEGQAIATSRIEIRVSHPPLPGDPRANMVFGGSDQFRGIGIEITPGTTEVALVLPCVDTKLLARSDAYNLDPKRNAYNFPAQGEVELHPETAKSNRIEIRVAEPEIDVTNTSR